MLKIQFKDGRADPIPLIEPGKTVGRGDANDIVIDEDGVNGFHADLKVEGTQVTITDINSSTGTLVNGEKINVPMPLGVGDLIVIQGVELEIIEDDELGGGRTLVLSGTALMTLGTGSWSLVADSGPEKGQVIPIMDRVEIGRALECDSSILEPALSRKHAELELVGDDLVLRDLGSVNGTYVNGTKIKKTALEDGDVISVGKHKLEFHSMNKPEAPAPKSMGAEFAQATVVISAPLQAPPLILNVIEGPQAGDAFTVDRSETQIGRAADNEIRLSGWSVAAHHALIRRKDMTYTIESYVRFRGTYVNGEKVQEQVLRPGDKLKIGSKITFLLEIKG